MAAERWVLLLAAVVPGGTLRAQGPILQRSVELHVVNVRLAEAMAAVAHDGGFKLSYNAALVNGDSIVTCHASGTVGTVMRGLVGDRLRLKESGEHLILLDPGTNGHRFRTAGLVVDRATGMPLQRASVFEVDAKAATITDAGGRFTLELSGQRKLTPLLVSRAEYRDTVVFVPRDGEAGRILLRASEKLERLEPRCDFERCAVEDLGVTRLLVSTAQMDQAANLLSVERRTIQASVLPNIGTNKKISGAVINTWSFNLLAGYARGLEGFELGVGVNMEREDVKGAQLAGLANLVGRNTSGLQVAGGLNHTMRSLNGVQIAGLGNTVWDTLTGVQISGGANVVKGGMQGTQITGFCNVTTQSLDGAQIAGGVNVTVEAVNKAQVAGGMNYGRSVLGAQVAGGFNVALRNVGGGQVAGGFNYARQVTGGQVAGGFNVAVDTVRGGQVGVLNFGRIVQGGQVGILNFSDTISGGAVGLLTISLKGYHRFDVITGDVMALSLQLRTGTRGFHNILGYSPSITTDQRWGFLYGIGTEPRIGRNGFLNIDLTAEQVVEQVEWVEAANILGRLGMSGGFAFADRITFCAGPVFNTFFSNWRDPETREHLTTIPPGNTLFTEVDGALMISGWLGWKASVGVRF